MRNVRISLVVITVLLISFGVVMIYSASAIYAYENLNDSSYFLKRHLVYLLIGFLAMGLGMSVDYIKMRKFAKPALALSLFLLALVLAPNLGREIGGARRWFRFFGLGFQPSELAKMALILYMAEFLSRKQAKIKGFVEGFLPPVLVLGAVIVLVLMQPDLGTALSMATITFIMLFAARAKILHLFSALLVSLPFLYSLVFSVPYRRQRIIAFLNPWADPQGAGFQIIQSQIALGSGGLLGVGLGGSRQKLFYLPASHTDFIFSIIGEELGLMGSLAVIILFIIFIRQAAKIALNSGDLFGGLLSLGITSMIGLEAIINIGVSLGSLPTKGLPLPFISYGGTSLVFKMLGVGILLNLAKDR